MRITNGEASGLMFNAAGSNPLMKYHEQPARPVCQREALSMGRAASTGRWLWVTMMVIVPMLLDGEWSNAIRPGSERRPGQEKRCWCAPSLPVGLRALNTKRKGSGANRHRRPVVKLSMVKCGLDCPMYRKQLRTSRSRRRLPPFETEAFRGLSSSPR